MPFAPPPTQIECVDIVPSTPISAPCPTTPAIAEALESTFHALDDAYTVDAALHTRARVILIEQSKTWTVRLS